MTSKADYQFDYSTLDPSLFDVDSRQIKAKKNLVVLRDYLGDLSRMSLLDVSSSTGIMTHAYAAEFRNVAGIDIDKKAMRYASLEQRASNLSYVAADALFIPLASESIDVVTCTQVYEHVPNARAMMDEIHRVLKPGGVCLFGATNRLNVIENHYGKLPFLSIIPKPLAHVYLRILGRAKFYYETHYTLWGLRALVSDFQIVDYSGPIIEEPERFSADDMFSSGSLTQRVALFLVKRAYWLLPGYVWILVKPVDGAQTESGDC